MFSNKNVKVYILGYSAIKQYIVFNFIRIITGEVVLLQLIHGDKASSY